MLLIIPAFSPAVATLPNHVRVQCHLVSPFIVTHIWAAIKSKYHYFLQCIHDGPYRLMQQQ